MPISLEIKQRFFKLYRLINQYNYEYYISDNPKITDIEYDRFFREMLEEDEQEQTLPDEAPVKTSAWTSKHFERPEEHEIRLKKYS